MFILHITYRKNLLKAGIQSIELHPDNALVIKVPKAVGEIKFIAARNKLTIHHCDMVVEVLQNDCHIPSQC